MTKEPPAPIELDYSAPPRRRFRFKLKWLLFAFAIPASLISPAPTSPGVGGTACGLWIAFALIHVQELKSQSSPQR